MKQKVSIVGGINLDIEGTPFNKLVYQDSNPGKIRMSYGGVGRNIVENLARMGGNCAMLSVIGEDSFGRGAVTELESLGVDTSMISVIPGFNSSMYMSVLQENKDMEVAINDMDIINEISPEMIRKNEDALRKSSMVCLDGNLSTELLGFACEMLEEVPLFFDPVSAAKGIRAKDVIGSFYAVKPNIMEAEVLTGIEINGEEDVRRAANILLDKGVKQVFITMNKDGVYFSDGKDSGVIRPSEDLKIESATGAGDAFSTAIIRGFELGMSIRETAKLGMAASALAMEVQSAVNKRISMEEVKRKGEQLYGL